MTFFRWSLVLGLLGSAAFAAGDPQLARDVEQLRNSLPLKDSSRPTLTLRLADILFDQAVEIGGNPLMSEAEQKQVKSVRNRALALYQEVLSGTQYHAPVSGALAIKIRFQIARLQQELGQIEEANKYWKELVKQEELTDLRREAALRLAEYYEKQKTLTALKEADTYYKLAIQLCGEADVCAYGHYRRAWALREAENLPAAIDEIQLALFDAKGQVRDEALRDLIVFLASERTDGEKALLLVEKLAAQTARPGLFFELAEAFYSAGNREAGTRALEHVNQRTPALEHQIRLLEEYYGLRNWDKFRIVLDQVSRQPVPPQGLDAKSEKILRRLSVQLDGERASREEFAPEFKSVVLLYLQLLPKHKDRFKMMEGWLAAEKDPAAKMKQIDAWLSAPDNGFTEQEQIQLRETRLALAVKGKDAPVIEAEAAKLAALVKDPTRAREYKYLQAVSVKEQGRVDEALAQVSTWALPTGAQDVWAFRGGLLGIDILVEQKKYSDIARVSAEWLNSPKVTAAAQAAKDKDKKVWTEGLDHLGKLREEARFEAAVAQGQTPAALEVFAEYCLAKKFLPKSCENGRVLAVQLKNQDVLIRLLKAMDRQSELAAEFEASGFFAESAELQEKALSPKAEDTEILKLALLYELGNRFNDRNRLLEDLAKRMKARKSAGEHEELIFATFRDAQMLGPSALDLPWSENVKLRLANQLELEGKASERTRKELLASKKAAGVAWSRHVLEGIAKLDAAQRKIGFYGRRGQEKFKARLAAIAKLDAEVEKYFPGADSKTRVRMAAVSMRAYSDLANEVLQSPVPAEISPEMLAEVKASLSAMAEPFQKKAADFQQLAQKQLSDIPVTEKAALEALLLPDASMEKIAQVENPAPAPKPVANVSQETYRKALGTLHSDPNSPSALTEIKSFYESQGKERLASYFQGRLLQKDSGKGATQ